MKTFGVDLVIEATAVCDLACKGCYAANTFTRSDEDLFVEKPWLYLDTAKLKAALNAQLGQKIESVAIRGGEPSRHPELDKIINLVAKVSSEINLETHGKWLLSENLRQYKALLESLRTNKVIVKISFDSMHGTSRDELLKMVDFLFWNEISYRIAITEENEEEFLKVRNSCSSIPVEHFIFQKKAQDFTGLMKPKLGVVTVSGAFQSGLSVKTSFLPKSESIRAGA